MNGSRDILIVVHPGSACGSADFNLELDAGPSREALAAEIHRWPHDLMIVDGELSSELDHYAILGLAIQNATERDGRRVVRQHACDFSTPDWPDVVRQRYHAEWPNGPHRVTITGAWYGDDGHGCVNAVATALGDQDVTVSASALRA